MFLLQVEPSDLVTRWKQYGLLITKLSVGVVRQYLINFACTYNLLPRKGVKLTAGNCGTFPLTINQS